MCSALLDVFLCGSVLPCGAPPLSISDGPGHKRAKRSRHCRRRDKASSGASAQAAKPGHGTATAPLPALTGSATDGNPACDHRADDVDVNRQAGHATSTPLDAATAVGSAVAASRPSITRLDGASGNSRVHPVSVQAITLTLLAPVARAADIAVPALGGRAADAPVTAATASQTTAAVQTTASPTPVASAAQGAGSAAGSGTGSAAGSVAVAGNNVRIQLPRKRLKSDARSTMVHRPTAWKPPPPSDGDDAYGDL